MLAGNGTWLAYVLATAAILLVAWCVGRFARYSSSPGSLYSYASMILPPWLGAVAAWSLFLAYVGTGASVLAGFFHYANILIHDATGHAASAVLLCTLATTISMWVTWRDVKISARLMLWIEAVSVTSILIVVLVVLVRHGLQADMEQFRLQGMTGSGLRLGLVLALFSFVGFESATTLGAEARDPLKTIPRAVLQSSMLGGTFFALCAYTEVLGFRVAGQNLANSDAPFRVLSAVGGVRALGLVIDVGAVISMFAGMLACITAAARVLLLMSHNGLTHGSLRRTHARNETPTGAIVVAYGLVCFALPRYLREHHGIVNAATKTIPWLAFTAMVLALVGNLYPVPEGPYGKLPYIYLAYLAAALLWFAFDLRRRAE